MAEPLVPYRCVPHRLPMRPAPGSAEMSCGSGCTVPVVGEIPRFVPAENYARSFGLQWNHYRKTQLDSSSGTTISRDRLLRLLGGSFDWLRGATVLEAGCGSGRFTELLLAAGARVVAVDLSSAVDANRANCGDREGYQVCQADIRSLPFAPGQFDVVVCVGVVQHTPSPEETIAALYSQLRPGGTLVIDHYSTAYPFSVSRRVLRASLLRMKPRTAWRVSHAVVSALWPLHRASWALARRSRALRAARAMWTSVSPVNDYQDAYPQLGRDQLLAWAYLDTHDALTDFYKHTRSCDQIRTALRGLGAADVVVAEGGNGVEARARKPNGRAAGG